MTSFKSWHLWLGAALLAVLTLALRSELSASSEFAQAESARRSGDIHAAIDHYQYALHWRSPFSTVNEQAAEALSQLATEARSRGEGAIELKALRRLRGGILATRSLAIPMPSRLDETNLRLAKAMAEAQMAFGGPTIGGRSQSELEAHHLALLRLDPAPHPGWGLVLILSFLAWVGLAVLIILRGVDASLAVRQPIFRRAALGGVFAFGLWIVALIQA